MRSQRVRWRIARRHLQPPPSHHRMLWTTCGLFLLLVLAFGVTAAGAMVFVSQLPPATDFRISYPFQDARIYDSRGDLLDDKADLNGKAGQRLVEPLQARIDPGLPRWGHSDSPRPTERHHRHRGCHLLQESRIRPPEHCARRVSGLDSRPQRLGRQHHHSAAGARQSAE